MKLKELLRYALSSPRPTPPTQEEEETSPFALSEAAPGAPGARDKGLALWTLGRKLTPKAREEQGRKNLNHFKWETNTTQAFLFDWGKTLDQIRRRQEKEKWTGVSPGNDIVEYMTQNAKGYIRISALRSRPSPSKLGWFNPQLGPNPLGSLFEINNSAAKDAWGSLMYDIALGLAFPGYLVSDRSSVSTSAQKVWSFYQNNRPDVVKIPLWNLEKLRNHGVGRTLEDMDPDSGSLDMGFFEFLMIPNLNPIQAINDARTYLYYFLSDSVPKEDELDTGEGKKPLARLARYFKTATHKPLDPALIEGLKAEAQSLSKSKNPDKARISPKGPASQILRELNLALEAELLKSPLNYAYHLPGAPTKASQASALVEIMGNTQKFLEGLRELEKEWKNRGTGRSAEDGQPIPRPEHGAQMAGDNFFTRRY